jgi:hypothetical protein
MVSDYLTTRQVAEEITESVCVQGSVREWQVRRLYEENDLAQVSKFAGKRAIPRSDLPKSVVALRRRGWLQLPKTELRSLENIDHPRN